MIWKVGNCGTGKRIWFVWRERLLPKGKQIASDKKGRYRRFASYEAAFQVAERLSRSDD